MSESRNVAFTSRQLRFIDWLAETKFDRKPPTQEKLAEEIGVSARTLVRWKKQSELMEAVQQRTRDLLKDDFPEILGALRREAIKGNFQHIKLALEMLGEFTDNQIVTVRLEKEIGAVLDILEQELKPDDYERILIAIGGKPAGETEA